MNNNTPEKKWPSKSEIRRIAHDWEGATKVMLLQKEAIDIALEALESIKNAQPPEELIENSEDEYGLESEEAIEMAYENVVQEAESAFNRIRSLQNP